MARPKSRPVVLSPVEREQLRRVVRTGSYSAQQVRGARILLGLDENDPDRVARAEPVPLQAVLAERAGVHVDTVAKTSKACAEHGGDVTTTISRKTRRTPPVEPIVTGQVEARLIALACPTPPEGHARWSLRLLEKHVALLENVPKLDHSTIGRAPKKWSFVLI